MKRRIKRALLVAIVLMAGGGILWLFSERGSRAVERWVGQQLVAVANGYLVPQIEFARLEYHYPRTVVVQGFRLRADDPAKPGEKVDIVTIRRLTLELGEIPRYGHPIRIQQLLLEQPELHFISVKPGEADYIGIDNLLRSERPGSTTMATTQNLQLSSIFEIQLIQVSDGLVTLDFRQSQMPVMQLDQINSRLKVQPKASGGGSAGWYNLDLQLHRVPLLDAQVVGKVNIDTMFVDMTAFEMQAKMGRQQDRYLPPALQDVVREHELGGQLNVNGKGMISLNDWRASELEMKLRLRDGLVAVGAGRWPVQAVDATWKMGNYRGRLDPLQVAMLGGTIEGTVQVEMEHRLLAHVDATGKHLRLEQTMRKASGREGNYRGDLSGRINWEAPLDATITEAKGNGELNLKEGRLLGLPVVGRILDTIGRAMKVVGMEGSLDQDTAQAEFRFVGDKTEFDRLDIDTSWAVLRGTGQVYFDKRLDLHIKGGPVQKAESLLGGVGRVLRQATDELAEYRVVGTLDKPKVGLKVVPGVHLPELR